MAKIKCPHCGATNQDVTTDDPCWQCGTILGAPVSALNTESGPPTSAANPAQPPAAPIPTTVQKTRPEPTLPPTRQPIPATRQSPQMRTALIFAIIIIILLLLIFNSMRHH